MGSAWFIAADTEHPEETIRFLDYLVSRRYDPTLARRRYAPGSRQASTTALTRCVPCTAISPTWSRLWDGPLAYHLDVLTPANWNTFVVDSMGEIPAGRMTAQELAEQMDVEMQKAVEEGRHADITG